MKNSDTCYRIRIVLLTWRRIRDSNPSGAINPLPVFKTSPFNHLGNSPLVDQADHDTATIRLWAEGSSFELLVRHKRQLAFETARLTIHIFNDDVEDFA